MVFIIDGVYDKVARLEKAKRYIEKREQRHLNEHDIIMLVIPMAAHTKYVPMDYQVLKNWTAAQVFTTCIIDTAPTESNQAILEQATPTKRYGNKCLALNTHLLYLYPQTSYDIPLNAYQSQLLWIDEEDEREDLADKYAILTTHWLSTTKLPLWQRLVLWKRPLIAFWS